MKIGIDATALVHPHPTGVEVVTRDLLRSLLAQDYDNHYFLYTPAPLPEVWLKFPQVTNRVLPPRFFWVLTRLSPALVQDHLDLFWSPSNLLPFHLPNKVLATIHDLAAFYFPRAYSLRSRLLSWLTTRRAIQFATKVLVVSQQTKTDLVTKFKLAPERVAVIPNALPQLPTADLSTPAQFSTYLLMVGRVEARKNPLTAIKAFALIAQQYPKLQLVFAGGFGFQSDDIKQLVEEVGLSHRIHFLGFVDANILANLYIHATAVLFPSLYEGFGLPVLEAFHYGIPVIASTAPAVAEVAGDGAILVDPTDAIGLSQAIVKLLEEPELRAHLIEQGTHRLQEYSWQQSAEKLLIIIKSL